VLTRLSPLLLLTALGLLFFAPLVLHPTQVLYSDHSDLLAEHVPAKRFLVGSWRETGELPRWCPYLFAGGPFLHDIQVGAFYPPHFLLFLLPEEAVAPALSWLVVLHVLLAGWLMYGYALESGLGRAGATVAAIGYMFAGKWLLHLLGAGHYITIGLAWLPLAVLCLERAVRIGSLRYATWAGMVYGLMALGTQPQWTFYSGLFLGAWTLGTALYDTNLTWRGALLRWVACGAWAAFLAVGIATVQFLPTLELAGQSTRSGGVDFGDLLSGGRRALLFFVGPSLTSEPIELEWEDRGGFGLLWIVVAAVGPQVRPDDRRLRYRAAVVLGMCLFAFGGCVLFQWLPGFRLFRQHARILMVATFPIAWLAGMTMHILLTSSAEERVALLARCRWVLVRVIVGVIILCGFFAVRLVVVEHVRPRFHPYWASLLLTIPTAFWLFRKGLLRNDGFAPVLLGAILLVDVWALAWPLVQVRAESEVFFVSESVRYLAAEERLRGRVLDRDTAGQVCSPLGRGALLAPIHRIEAIRGYTPLDLLRFKEYLLFVMDHDLPLRPLMQDHDVTRADPTLDGESLQSERESIRGLTYPVMQNFPIRNHALLDLLQVRYLLQPANEPLVELRWRSVFQDPSPRAYDFGAGGVHDLPAYKVAENPTVMDRAFVVPHAEELPERAKVLERLKATDFRQTVLLEPAGEAPVPTDNGVREGFVRRASIESYRPNEVVVHVEDGPAGYLVLTDVWFPGWTCKVDGEKRTIHRANYLFRALPIEPGEHHVVFTFEPESLRRGRQVLYLTIGIILGVHLLAGLAWVRQRRPFLAGAAGS
jgi:hypothetical protein